MPRARLAVIAGDAKPDVLDLMPEQPVTLGRSRDNTIVLRDEHASRLHARIYFENDQWLLRDFGLNGTKVNGERIPQVTDLENGNEISVGEIRIRFSIEDLATSPPKTWRGPMPQGERRSLSESVMALSTTKLQSDELTSLCQFMAAAVEVDDPRDLIREALRTLFVQTGACLVGYLSLDPTDPVPKIVVPESATVDAQLSRQLTRRVQRDGKMVWLGADLADTHHSESLTPFNDALCLPLRAGGISLGALHIYRSNHFFPERAVRFSEALSGYLSHCLHVLRVRRNLEAENSRLRAHASGADELVGDSPAMMKVRQLIGRAAPQPFTVMINGESGSGKELVALALHRQSQRAEGPLVVVNCAAIAPALMEAELFGYRKGSFSGADRDHPGLFQQADEGTLFLDEVGELSLDCQAKLLRVIEGKAFRPIGATHEVKSDVRIVAATHRDLEADVKSGKFRQDLFYRLRVIQIPVPPLRDHPEDIPYLVQYFLDKLAVEMRRSVKVTDAAMCKLENHSWPGNVRQLLAVLQSAVVMSESDTLDADSLVLTPTESGLIVVNNGLALDRPPSLKWDDLENWAIEQALKETGHNVSQAAKLLGMSRDTLHNRIRKKHAEKPVHSASDSGE